MVIIDNDLENIEKDIKPNTLYLCESEFPLNENHDKSYLYIGKDEDNIEIWADFSFKEAIYSAGTEFEDTVSPSFSINPIDTEKTDLDDLIGTTFLIESFEESDEREDTMYMYEHEPLMSYSITIAELFDKTARVICRGGAITDGYARPPIETTFIFDCIVHLKKDF